MTASLPDRLRKAADELDSLRLAEDAALMREAAEMLSDDAARERAAFSMHRLDFTAGTVEVVDGNQPPAARAGKLPPDLLQRVGKACGWI